MRTAKVYITLIFTIQISIFNTSAQILNKNQYTKVLIAKGQTFQIELDSIHIDTLIMENGSSLLFKKSSLLIIENAVIGNNCIWDGSGKNATEPGDDGLPGKSISAVIVIQSLGTLTINTQGGSGGKGFNGREGTPGTDGSQFADGSAGENGGDGGNGGDAGDIKFHYHSSRVISIVGNKNEYTVVLKNSGGSRGEGGYGGKGGRGGVPRTERDLVKDRSITVGNYGKVGRTGMKGNPGKNGTDGSMVFKRFD